MRNTIQLLLSSLVLALWVVPDAKAATSITYTVGGVQVTLTDLGVVPSGTSSSGLAINNRSQVAGMANAMNGTNWEVVRPIWDANTGVIIGFAGDTASGVQIPEHRNDGGEMA